MLFADCSLVKSIWHCISLFFCQLARSIYFVERYQLRIYKLRVELLRTQLFSHHVCGILSISLWLNLLVCWMWCCWLLIWDFRNINREWFLFNRWEAVIMSLEKHLANFWIANISVEIKKFFLWGDNIISLIFIVSDFV